MDTTFRKPAEAAPARMGPLAVLPVFLTLEGRRVLVAGGSDAAAWKAELTAAAGARVEVFAAGPGQVMAKLEEAGTLRIIRRNWTEADIDGAAIAICDAEDEAEAAAFAAAACTVGARWNVIDKPDFCDFQFGSIVNRSPVVIGISTAGAAPIIGQNLRRRIEAMLPQTLSTWAALALRIRQRTLDLLKPGAERRLFWERFSDLAFSRTVADEASAEALIMAAQASAKAPGHVTIVGAGPGDAEYLTIKAMRALQAADVILFDDLVSTEVLELARREAKRMMVGKRGGKLSCRQDDINALMVRAALAGKHVVRLKSGDPMIFGRAGEEIAELSAAGIPVDVVPGISAAFGLAARLGVSLTHRDHAQSVRFVTGHARDGSLPKNLDWKGLADPATTLVVYMGAGTSRLLASRLIAEGLSGGTPVVVAEAVSRPEEAIRAMTLGALAEQGAALGAAPVLIGIGRCFAEARAASRGEAALQIFSHCA
ncbi:siroheme synthase [Agaricicola taiwanensis]|uniref:Siroheme synthase n=1 Tax=Agaricicola taiwanensis TaxID=591372 RepID=A0A8J2YI46_9RHOB|nr:siroheme synthase CysG [Agaricicola taiwanensis]GGE44464.1 siroheme synthase [Agaricicola taiwanensis]